MEYFGMFNNDYFFKSYELKFFLFQKSARALCRMRIRIGRIECENLRDSKENLNKFSVSDSHDSRT